MHERVDLAIGVRARQHGENREQDDMRGIVELALGAAGVVDLLQDFEKIREWFHGQPTEAIRGCLARSQESGSLGILNHSIFKALSMV